MPNHPQAEIAIIGGSGLYEIQGFAETAVVDPDTPYGKPSDAITVGELQGASVAFLPRHGRGHRVSPSELPFRANIYALKTLGVRRIVSVSAVGSLQAPYQPQHLVIPDQLIDRTRARKSTFLRTAWWRTSASPTLSAPPSAAFWPTAAKGRASPLTPALLWW